MTTAIFILFDIQNLNLFRHEIFSLHPPWYHPYFDSQLERTSLQWALQVTATLKIHEEQMDNFKALAKQCIATVKEKNTGTLQYDWFLDEVNRRCIVREKYASSDAVLEYMGNLGDLLGQLLATCTLEIEVFGTPSQALIDATAEMAIKVYPYFGGL